MGIENLTPVEIAVVAVGALLALASAVNILGNAKPICQPQNSPKDSRPQ